MVCICVLSFVVLNATMTQLQACILPHYNVLAEANCCCLLKTRLFATKWLCPVSSVYGNLLLWKISWLDLISFLSYASWIWRTRRRRRRRWRILNLHFFEYLTLGTIIFNNFWNSGRFSCPFCLNVIRCSFWLKLKAKIEIFKCTHMMLDNHGHPYMPSTTVLGDNCS